MAYYEMMPAGLPAGLQSGMDSVLNKKFGTATSYAPGTWPDTVNLMGPLPEKTIVSSPVADFSDGADDVPTKSLVVTIPPTLSVSLVTETQTGRNLFYVENSSLFPRDNNTIVNNVGTYTAWAKVKKNTDYYIKKSGNTNRQNVFGCTSVPAVGVTTHMITRIEYATNEYSFNSGEYEYIGFYYSSEASENMMLSTSQSALTPYEAYNATQYTASLGRTIYGGEVDIVNGTGTDENGNDFTFDGQEVPTRLGYNAFWSDEGDTEVTYRADINLALQALSGSRGLMMARPQLEPETEPEETKEETPEEMEK